MASDVEQMAEERLAEALAVIAYEQPPEPWRVAHDALRGTARALTPATDGVVHTPIEADGKIPVEFYQWLYGIERDVLVWSLTPNEIAALVAALSANRDAIEAEIAAWLQSEAAMNAYREETCSEDMATEYGLYRECLNDAADAIERGDHRALKGAVK